MDKRGVSPLVASILLVLLTVILASVVYYNMKLAVLYLAPEPEVDCYGLDFVGEIVREPSANYLDVANRGNLQIGGFYIKLYGEGDIGIYEEIVRAVAPGETTRIALTRDYLAGKYVMVPRVEGEDLNEKSYLRPCKDLYGQEIILN